MKVILKIALSIVFITIALLTLNFINQSDSEYNIGLFTIGIIIGSIAGIITMWSYKPEYTKRKKNSWKPESIEKAELFLNPGNEISY
jgi:hypothetical protein